MPSDDDDDLYDGDYEFVDDEDDEEAEGEEAEEEPVDEKPKKKAKRKPAAAKAGGGKKKKTTKRKSTKKAGKVQKVELDEVEDEESDHEESDVDETEIEASEPADEATDEYGRPEPVANYVVHVYEVKKYKRTIDYAFTPEDADAFAAEYNRTSKSYSRWAVPGKADVKPGKVLAP